MEEVVENRKRIAKNTLLLYVRMAFAMIVNLYTSRIILKTLGAEDFGIYGVVGGIVTMFSFLNASMAGATSRFLTFELGRGNEQSLKETFISAFYIHIFLCVIIVFAAETIGLWFLNNKLVIPPDRIFASNWVYQLSILSMIISVTQVPYNASIIAHEKISVFAYVEIINVGLRLLIVYLLLLGNNDKLILYAVLYLSVSLLIAGIYRVYCIKTFNECKIKIIGCPKRVKSMLMFSGWDIYGNMCLLLRSQGVNMLLNMFFGPVLNAATGIAAQVQSASMSFSSNVLTAVRPQIIKSYAMGKYGSMNTLLIDTICLNFFLMLLICVPILAEIDFVLRMWLGIVPHYTDTFCSFLLLSNIFESASGALICAIHATGNVKKLSFYTGTVYILVLPITYILFISGLMPWVSYAIIALSIICNMFVNALILKGSINTFPLSSFIFRGFLKCILILISSYTIVRILHFFLEESWFRFVTSCILSTIIIATSGWFFLLPNSIKTNINQIYKNRFKRWKSL